MITLPKFLPYVAALPVPACHQSGIRGMLLDLDNTLVSEDDSFFTPHLSAWLQEVRAFEIQLFLVSNGSRKERFAFWSSFLGISGVCNARKPFKSGIELGVNHLNIPKNQLIIIGDTWPTDVLAGRLSAIKTVRVASLPHPPRFWERLFPFVQHPYPPGVTPPEKIPTHVRDRIPQKII